MKPSAYVEPDYLLDIEYPKETSRYNVVRLPDGRYSVINVSTGSSAGIHKSRASALSHVENLLGAPLLSLQTKIDAIDHPTETNDRSPSSDVDADGDDAPGAHEDGWE